MVLPIVGLTDVIEYLEFYLASVWADELLMNIRFLTSAFVLLLYFGNGLTFFKSTTIGNTCPLYAIKSPFII